MALGKRGRAQYSNFARAVQGDHGRPKDPWDNPARAQFDASKSFDVVGCDSGRRYRIHYGRVTNVHEIDDAGQPVTGWCFVPSGHLVAGDVMLAQKIALETNERTTLALANRFNVKCRDEVHQHSPVLETM